MSLTAAYYVIVALVVLVAIFAAALAFRVDDKIEARRKVAFDLAAILGNIGLDDFVPLAKCYTVGDYSGVVAEIEKVAANLQNTEKAKKMFASLFYKQLIDRLADPVEKIKILAEVNKKPADLEAAAKTASAVASSTATKTATATA